MKGDPSQSVSQALVTKAQTDDSANRISIPEVTEFVTVYMMADSEDTAVHMATTLVRERLVACANIENGTRSVYEYNGMIQLENEVTLFMKTTAERAPAVVERLRALHSYEIPCITILPIFGGNPDYLTWVREQVADDAAYNEPEKSGQDDQLQTDIDHDDAPTEAETKAQYVPKSADFGS